MESPINKIQSLLASLCQRLNRKKSGSDILSILSHAKNYFSANIAVKALGIISMPIYTRLLTKEGYGILSVYSTYASIFGILLTFNLAASLGRYKYEETDDFNEFLGTTIILLIFAYSITAPLFFVFQKNLELPGVLPFLLFITTIYSTIFSLYRQILIPEKRSKEYSAIQIIRGYSGFIISLALVLIMTHERYLGIIYGGFISLGIISIYILIKLKHLISFRIQKKHIKYILSFSLPLIPYSLSGIILVQFDRIMISKSIDYAAVGLYSLAYNISMLLSLVISSLNTAFIPDFFRFLKRQEFNRLDASIEKIFSLITLSAFGLILFAREIIIILADKKFHESLNIIPIVVIGIIFYGMFTVYGRYIGYSKKTILSSINILAAGIINIILNAVYIPKYGYVAAAYTTVVSYFLLFVFTWITAKYILKHKTTPLIVIWRPVIYLFVFLGGFFLIQQVLENGTILFLIKIIFMLLFSYTLSKKYFKISHN